MNTTTPAELLQEIAKIQRMEPGKLCVMRKGPSGPYYNLQCREGGRTLSQYVPRDQVEAVAEHTANHQRFRELMAQYAGQVIERTRRERRGAQKKTMPPKGSGSRNTKKSKP